jgi:hydrogenase/urease accessory protein HupE
VAWAILRSLLALLMLAMPLAPQAHEMTMVDLSVREAAPGDFIWAWGVPARGRPVSEDLVLTWPKQCETHGQALRCGAAGLVGRLSVEGVGKSYSAVIARIRWKGGETQTITLTAAQPSVNLLGGARDPRGPLEVAQTYGVLGVEHILSGWDHLLFVVSLLLLVGFERRLVATITAFTLAHSLTLALSAMNLLTLRSPPVEATIALSILLVCGEALRERDTLSRRWPALVAFVFGLVHGLGFAGALKEIGLPEQHLSIALLSFNLGVEAGQLIVVAAGAAVVMSWRRLSAASAGSGAGAVGPGLRLAAIPWRTGLGYAIGGTAAYWTITRLGQILLQGG